MSLRALVVAVSLVAVAACGGSSGGAADVTAGGDADATATPDGATVTPGERVEPTWQLLYGVDTDGTSYDREGVVGLGVAGDGTLVVVADRRYGSDSYGNALLVARVGPDGTAQGIQRLQFDGLLEVNALAVRPNGNLVIAVESGTVAELDTAGAVVWSVALSREPYAFGGFDVAAVRLDDAGAIYVAGAFNPSEGFTERGFVARLGPTGDAVWMRSWAHEAFVDDQQLAVGPAGVYVADRLEGRQEISSRYALFAFSAAGDTLGKVDLVLPETSPRFAAVTRAALLPDASGVTLVGTRSTAVDEDFAVLVYRVAFDASLAVTGQGGTRIPYDVSHAARAVAAVRGADGVVRAALRLGDGYAPLRFPAGAMAAEAYDLVRGDGAEPMGVDEDHPLMLAAGPDGSTYLAGTAFSTGALAIEPRASMAVGLPLGVEELGEEVFEDALSTAAEALDVTAGDDEVGVTGEARDGDEDMLVVRAPF